MKTIKLVSIAATIAALTGCAGYNYSGSVLVPYRDGKAIVTVDGNKHVGVAVKLPSLSGLAK